MAEDSSLCCGDGDDNMLTFEEDPRTACKYGAACYQKNPKHHQIYKHPSKRKIETNGNSNKKTKKNNSCIVDNNNEISESLEVAENDCTDEDIGESSYDLPESPLDPKENIKQKFLVEMPEDFYSFWDFCKTQNPSLPQDALKLLNLKLVGPFDVLSGNLKNIKTRNSEAYLRHWRFYYDPPEFQTILVKKDDSQFHIGYFRDDPNEMPAFVASNTASENCLFQSLGPNIFAAVNCHISSMLKQSKFDTKLEQKIKSFSNKLKQWATEHNLLLEMKPASLKAREKKVVARTFHGAGIVVPVDKKTEVGYRPVPETNAFLKKMFQKIADSKTPAERSKNLDSLQEIITLVQFANDECDYGMGLELGIDLFSFGSPSLHSSLLSLLPLAYDLLNRPQYAQIVKAHLKDRNKSGNLSIK